MTEKIIIFGAGFLGTRIGEYLNCQVTKTNPLDFSQLQSFLDHENPTVVINAIGKTGRPNIDWCESHRQETFESNIVAASNLSTSCSKRGIYFVHLGSGCIYSGDNHNKGFTENDEPNFYGPQFYAKSKILSEKILREFPGLILRIRMPVDDRPNERNLIDKLLKYPAVIEIPNSMTTVPHMLDAIKTMVDKRMTGIYNLVNPGLISAADIMTMYQEIVDSSHKFSIMSLDQLDSRTAGKRSNCYLNTEKLKSKGIELPEIHQAVEQCLLSYKSRKK